MMPHDWVYGSQGSETKKLFLLQGLRCPWWMLETCECTNIPSDVGLYTRKTENL